MLDRQTILDRLAEHADELRNLGAESLALFGSFARDEGRDEGRDDSDVDLLVELDRRTFDRYMDLRIRLEDILERRVDLVQRDRIKPRIREQILSEAIRAA
ncbi:MAG: nucleotidyltransferase domain-containing protein [Planctomycetota bacterium]